MSVVSSQDRKHSKDRLHDFDSKGIDEVEFKQWISTDRSNLETVILTVEKCVALFSEKLNMLQRHDFIALRQAQLLQGTKNALAASEFLVIGDFAENYAIVVEDASQSFHWNNVHRYCQHAPPRRLLPG